jgi:hypothetical protein
MQIKQIFFLEKKVKNSSLPFNNGSRLTITKRSKQFYFNSLPHQETKTTKNLRTKYSNDDDNDELNFR